jgi:N-sulfoglucosamine sulfohydrolase
MNKSFRTSLPQAVVSVLALIVNTTDSNAVSAAKKDAPPSRPNILWITCEDTSPHFSFYGDPYGTTPNLDKFARQAVRFDNAFAYTGVCAPSRSCLITGVNPTRLGSHHMRSNTRLPENVKCFPQYLREAGYFCSNNYKTDYNFPVPRDAWDQSSPQAHWRNRQPGQPFFSVFNITVCHQSGLFGSDEQHRNRTRRVPDNLRHDPARAPIPPFHPDTPEFRKDWARHYDNLTAMDIEFADRLAELEAAGLADDTIVFWFADNGTGMPGIKWYVWDWGVRVPMLVRFPKKWQHLAPAAPGGSTGRLVTFVDFAPTILNLCGLNPPAHMEGVPFLGEKTPPAPKYVFGGRDRMGASYDLCRYVRSERFHYLRNFLPQYPWGQFSDYGQSIASLRAWQDLRAQGKLHGLPARFYQAPKPIEELYDQQADPFQTNNLAANPAHQKQLRQFRAECVAWMKRTGDLGLLSEYELWQRARNSTPYEIAKDPNANPLDELLDAAWTANQLDAAQIPKLVKLLRHRDCALRWWGAMGLAALGPKAAPALAEARAALKDESPDVRIAAAEVLANLGHEDAALPILRAELKQDNEFVRLAALNALSRMGGRALPALADVRAAGYPPARTRRSHAADSVTRMVAYLPDHIEHGKPGEAPGPAR